MTLLRLLASVACFLVLASCSNLPFIGGDSENADTDQATGTSIQVSDATQSDVSVQSANGSFLAYSVGRRRKKRACGRR